MEKPALIFDLDGTLWDSAEPVAEIWTEIGRRYLRPDFHLSGDEVRSHMGFTMDEILERIAPHLPKEKRAPFAKEFLDGETTYLSTHPGHLFPKEIETLQLLQKQGYRLYIVSNCQTGYIEDFLPLVPASLFADHMCWSDTKQPKNVTIRSLMDRNGIERAIYIGDTRGDEVQTRLANLPFCFASYGFGKAEHPDLVLHEISDLPEALMRFLAKEE